jgi:hypothetical protein
MRDFPLNRVDNPQSGGKPYKNDYQRSGFGAYTGGLGTFCEEPHQQTGN